MTTEVIKFILENEETIIKDLNARTKYFSLLSISPEYINNMTIDYIKDLCRSTFNNLTADDLIEVFEEPHIKEKIDFIINYLNRSFYVNKNSIQTNEH